MIRCPGTTWPAALITGVFTMVPTETMTACGGLIIAFLKQLIKLGVPQKRFCWNAAPIETGAPCPLLLDAGNLLAKLSRANGSHVAGGSAADNNQPAFFGRKATFSPHEWANLGEAAHSPKQRRPVGSETKPIKASIDAPTVNAITFYVAPLAIFTPGPFVRLFTISR
jgi:hypothetical protein